jgi:hypothetical protein
MTALHSVNLLLLYYKMTYAYTKLILTYVHIQVSQEECARLREGDTGSFPSVSVQSEREVVRTINTQENILQMVQRSPRLSTRRMASRRGISYMK